MSSEPYRTPCSGIDRRRRGIHFPGGGFIPGGTLVFLLGALLAGAAPAGESLRIRVGLSRAPSALPVLRLIDSGALAGTAELAADLWTGPEQLIALAQAGEHQLFSLPLTVAARLRARGVDIKLTNVNTWGGIALVTANPGIGGWADLRGRIVHAPGSASPPAALLRHFLGLAGLRPGIDIEIVTAGAAEMAQLLRAGRIETAVLLEPQTTAALSGSPGLRRVLDFETEWRRREAGGLPSLGFGGPAAFLDANPEFVRRFEEEFARALAWILEHPAEAGKLAAGHLGLEARIVEEALPRLGLGYRRAAEAAGEVTAYLRLVAPGPEGNPVPDEAFYWR